MRTVTAIFTILIILFITSSPGLAIDVKSRLFYEIVGFNWEEAMAGIDAYAIQLQAEPDKIGVIIVYGGRYARRGEAQAMRKCLNDYIVNRRGISANRIVLLNGGYRELIGAEMWISVSKEYIRA